MSTKIYAKARFGLREDTLENWVTNNPVLEKGEPAVISDSEDSRWLKIGDGKTDFNSLPWKFAGGTVADKEYDPTSENAQSGIAVAKAINGISEVWEQITNITLEEAAVVNITKDMNGDTLSLKKFKILVELPAVTSATTLWLKMNNILAMPTQPASANGTPAYSINGEYTYEWQLSTCTHPANAFSASPIYATPYGHRYAAGSIPFPCTSIGLALNSAVTNGLPSGAKVKIWGVRA